MGGGLYGGKGKNARKKIKAKTKEIECFQINASLPEWELRAFSNVSSEIHKSLLDALTNITV